MTKLTARCWLPLFVHIVLRQSPMLLCLLEIVSLKLSQVFTL